MCFLRLFQSKQKEDDDLPSDKSEVDIHQSLMTICQRYLTGKAIKTVLYDRPRTASENLLFKDYFYGHLYEMKDEELDQIKNDINANKIPALKTHSLLKMTLLTLIDEAKEYKLKEPEPKSNLTPTG